MSKFENTTVGLEYAEVNMRHNASGVQVYKGALGMFFVAVPASVRHTGIRAVVGLPTLADALAASAPIVAKAEAKMNRLHAAALKMNAAR